LGEGLVLMPWFGWDGAGVHTTYVIRSADNGRTWQAPVAVLSDAVHRYTEASFIDLGASRVLGLVRVDNGPHFRQVLSTDNGATWTDQGDATFDAFPNTGPAWLSRFTARSGREVVVAYYQHRAALEMRAVYAWADDVAAGVSGWQVGSRTVIARLNPKGATSGYPTVVHPAHDPRGLGWYYEEWTRTNTALVFFAVAPSTTETLTLVTSPDQPPASGVSVRFTAVASGGTPPYEFKWRRLSSTGWTVVQDWSTADSYTGPPALVDSADLIEVWVRSAISVDDAPERWARWPEPPATEPFAWPIGGGE
jgi:hypothetical protein